MYRFIRDLWVSNKEFFYDYWFSSRFIASRNIETIANKINTACNPIYIFTTLKEIPLIFSAQNRIFNSNLYHCSEFTQENCSYAAKLLVTSICKNRTLFASHMINGRNSIWCRNIPPSIHYSVHTKGVIAFSLYSVADWDHLNGTIRAS